MYYYFIIASVFQYLGLWYEVERYFSAFELLVKCVSVDYKDDGDGVMGITSKQLSFVLVYFCYYSISNQTYLICFEKNTNNMCANRIVTILNSNVILNLTIGNVKWDSLPSLILMFFMARVRNHLARRTHNIY